MAQKRSKGQGGGGGAGQKGKNKTDERDANLSNPNVREGASRPGGSRDKEELGAGNTKADRAAEEALNKPTQLSDRSGRGGMNEPGNPPGQEGPGAEK